MVTVIQGLQGEYSFIPKINPIEIALSTFHSMALFLVLSFAVITGWGRRFEGLNGEPVTEPPQEIHKVG